MSGSFIYVRFGEPRVKNHSLGKEPFPIPLKYNDVTRIIQTNLDVRESIHEIFVIDW